MGKTFFVLKIVAVFMKCKAQPPQALPYRSLPISKREKENLAWV
jgi:hypothetical protein